MSGLLGEAVQIVSIDESDHSFILDEIALNKIVNQEDIKDKPICVLSVAGTYLPHNNKQLKTLK